MIPANIIHRVFRIQVNEVRGTAFTLDIDNRQYLVTARHLMTDLSTHAEIGIFSNGGWTPLRVDLVAHCDDPIDVTVTAPSRRLSPAALQAQAGSSGVFYSQDVFFLGFPYDFLGNIVFTESGFPLPFVKKAILACFDKDILLLDGHNNPGFSGGPVVFSPKNDIRADTVAAVISGYRAVQEPVYAGGQQTPLAYVYNTGIIVSYSIDQALKAIASNPTGLPLD